MAKFEVEIEVPAVPSFLRVKLPGQKRGSSVPLSEFSEEQLRALGEAYTEQLLSAKGSRRKKHPAENAA